MDADFAVRGDAPLSGRPNSAAQLCANDALSYQLATTRWQLQAALEVLSVTKRVKRKPLP